MSKLAVSILLLTISSVGLGSVQYWDPHDIKYRYTKNRVVGFDGLIFGQCLQQEVMNFRSSSEIKHDYPVNPLMNGLGRQCELTSQSLMAYLMAQKDRCDFQTGNEAQLKEYILKQKDNLIDPIMLF